MPRPEATPRDQGISRVLSVKRPSIRKFYVPWVVRFWPEADYSLNAPSEKSYSTPGSYLIGDRCQSRHSASTPKAWLARP